MAQTPLDADLDIIAQSDLEVHIDPLTKDVSIIQKLDDEPNDVGGLSAQELKEKFDEAGNIIKDYINDTLVPQCLSEGVVENQRKAQEAQRQSNETQRQTAEQLRADAERLRSEAERLRVDAERLREEAEALRGTVFIESQQAREQVFDASQEDREMRFTEAQKEQEGRFLAAEEGRNSWEEYNAEKAYVPGNKVYYLGSSYACRAACTGILPDDARYWQIIAKRGLDGEGATPYSYAKEGGYAGTDDEFRAAMASAPWLPTKGGDLSGDLIFNLGKKIVFKGGTLLNGVDQLFSIQAESDHKISQSGTIQSSDPYDSLAITGGGLDIDGPLYMNFKRIRCIGKPSDDYDAANKGYVDDAVAAAKSYAATTGVTSFKGRTGAVTPASGDYTAAQVGAVPTTRRVNNKALSSDISLTASDVGAASFVTIASNLSGSLSNMIRTYNVSGWANYSIICMDIATPSGYNYTVKPNGQSGSFWYSGSPEYGKGIAYLHGGVKARLIFFPMRSGDATVSCVQVCTLPGHGYVGGLTYKDLRTFEIAPEGAVAFGSAIPVTITAIK